MTACVSEYTGVGMNSYNVSYEEYRKV